MKNKNKQKITIAIVEDSEPYASTLKEFFDLPGSIIDCQAIYSTAEEALQEIPQNPPEIVLMDINLPKTSGIACIARLKESCPSLLSLVLTMYEEHDLIFDSLRAGACGYLLKRTAPTQIVEALIAAHNGGSPISPYIARQVVDFFQDTSAQPPKGTLTAREQEVLDLLIKGMFYKEIADILDIKIDTVRSHIRKVYSKLQIHSRTDIILKFGKNR